MTAASAFKSFRKGGASRAQFRQGRNSATSEGAGEGPCPLRAPFRRAAFVLHRGLDQALDLLRQRPPLGASQALDAAAGCPREADGDHRVLHVSECMRFASRRQGHHPHVVAVPQLGGMTATSLLVLTLLASGTEPARAAPVEVDGTACRVNRTADRLIV